jgi:hypothetical protein
MPACLSCACSPWRRLACPSIQRSSTLQVSGRRQANWQGRFLVWSKSGQAPVSCLPPPHPVPHLAPHRVQGTTLHSASPGATTRCGLRQRRSALPASSSDLPVPAAAHPPVQYTAGGVLIGVAFLHALLFHVHYATASPAPCRRWCSFGSNPSCVTPMANTLSI